MPDPLKLNRVKIMEVFGDGHRLFIQSMMSRGMMNISEVKEVISGKILKIVFLHVKFRQCDIK